MTTRRNSQLLALALVFALAGLAASQCVPPPPGLISWWTGDGDATDLVGPNHGTPHHGVSIVPGMVDQAFELDGIDDFISAGSGPSVRPNFPFSVDFWVNVDSADWFYALALCDTAGNGVYTGFRVAVTPGGGVMTAIGNNLGCCEPRFRRNFFSPDGLISIGGWHHVAAVFEEVTNHRIYVDGALQPTTESGTATVMKYGPYLDLEIGRAYDPNDSLFLHADGLIDEIEFHQGILDSISIQSIYLAGSEGKCKEAIQEVDFGDAPSGMGYPTLLADDGARHIIDTTLFLGASVDAEPDGQPNANSTGDDLNGLNDDDGLQFLTPISPGGSMTIEVSLTGDGYLSLWLDMAADGSWAQAEDLVLPSTLLAAGFHMLVLDVPRTGGEERLTHARARFSSAADLSWSGEAPDGEVEDYEVLVSADLTPVVETPARFLRLDQNVPNPFNPRTTIPFVLDRPSAVRLVVYDARGALVRRLIDEVRPAGAQSVSWDGRDDAGSAVASGVYMIELRADGDRKISKAVLVR